MCWQRYTGCKNSSCKNTVHMLELTKCSSKPCPIPKLVQVPLPQNSDRRECESCAVLSIEDKKAVYRKRYRQRQKEKRENADATQAAHVLVAMSRTGESSRNPTRQEVTEGKNSAYDQQNEQDRTEIMQAAQTLLAMSRSTEPFGNPTRRDEGEKTVLPVRNRQ